MATARDFEFDRIEAFVKKHGATVLALQFPAHLLAAAPAVATALAARLGAAPEIYVLGDPVPRGAVDCVGAAHVDADALVKCGADCLTPPPDGAPPTLFVRGPAAAVDVAGVARHIEELLIEEGPVLLLVAPEHAPPRLPCCLCADSVSWKLAGRDGVQSQFLRGRSDADALRRAVSELV